MNPRIPNIMAIPEFRNTYSIPVTAKDECRIAFLVKYIFRFSKFQVTIFLFPSPFVVFLYPRAARVISQINQPRQRT